MIQLQIKYIINDIEVPNKEHEIEKEKSIEKKEQEQVANINTNLGASKLDDINSWEEFMRFSYEQSLEEIEWYHFIEEESQQ